MTTLVSNNSSAGRRSGKDKKLHQKKASSSNSSVPSNSNTESTTHNNHVAEEFRNKIDKFQPTAEQMRIASLMSDKKEDDLKPQIDKIVELTGATSDRAAVALFDSGNDMPKAIERILDGESFDSEWQSTGKKKKTKAQTNPITETLTNGSKTAAEKPARSNNKNNTGPVAAQAKGPRGSGVAGGKNIRKKERNTNETNVKNDTEESDVFNASTDSHKKPKPTGKRGAPRGRASRGKGMTRGSRIFMNRGMQNNDGFPNSIETWTNNTVEPTKTANDDINTMAVGNWSDVAANEDWSEEDWSAPVETKVFTPSNKVIPEKDELKDQSKTINHNSHDSQVYLSSVNKTEDASQPTMSSIISNNMKRPPPASAGQALLQQIQQSNVSQNSINQYNLSQYSKQATESIKSLVGMTSNNMITSEHSLETLSKASQPPNANRMKVQNMTTKITESAVEMPSSDPISKLTVHFGSLDFGSNNFPMASNDANIFDSVNQSATKKSEKNLPLISNNTNASETNYRTSNATANSNKNILQGQVLPHSLNDSILNNDHRTDKSLNHSSYNPNKPLERKQDYISMNYKSTYPQTTENVYSSGYQPSSIAANIGYYSNANQVPFANANAVNQNLIPNNAYSSMYNNTNTQKVIRDMDNSVQTPQVNVSSAAANKSYDTSSLSLMSSSTSTTNVIKNTLPSTGKGIHNVPPGVTNSVQPTQVQLSAPYLMGGTGLPLTGLPTYYSYDLQFQNAARDHSYSQYTPDVKYNRNSESEMLPVSSQTATAAQTATQAHNPYYPGYGFYFGFAQNVYGATQPALYPVPQTQNTPSNSAFAKQSTAANYGSHSYNSGYDSMGNAVQAGDYVNKPYQHNKQVAADMTTNQNIYNKNHPQLNKNYDKQGFQAQATLNLTNPAQSAANLSSAYNNTYMLPHQPIHHSFANAEPTQQASGPASQRTLPQTHKNISSNSSYTKFNWT